MGLLRVILAMSVVLTHVGGISGYYMAGSTPSVQMFYIISGFYMATVLTEKYDPRTDIGIFLRQPVAANLFDLFRGSFHHGGRPFSPSEFLWAG